MSAVNFAEVVGKLAEAGGTGERVDTVLRALHLRIESFDESQARTAGMLRVATRVHGPSLGDRSCLALAMARDAVALTGDRAWAALAPALGAKVEVDR